ncbi:M56 family metallopeptidase [Altibacter sp.]|uniref:M56 family metallopeptidase n=1 Tax=Altibacter sp. TaxID=2024823 RepID=UPI000C90407C|nr:M56 family metallopeptidase [Altibacter sp.]MAP55343.1 hypothetical protein [Altibacter sp.]
MELYVLKSAACLAGLYVFYMAFLENTTLHVFKRFYLLGSVVIALVIPLITFTTFIEVPEPHPTITYVEASGSRSSEQTTILNYVPAFLWSVYIFGMFFFAFRFIRNISDIVLKIKQNPKQRYGHFIHVLLPANVTPHTFFRYIFLNKTRFEAREIPSEVLLHEQTHALQKHSIDILCIELLHIIFWFNPLLYFIKRSIKLNHEFLADRAVLQQGIETTHYQQTLLTFASHTEENILANAIHYSSIKKRFTIMKTKTSKRSSWIRGLLLLPLLAVLVLGFSTQKTVAQKKDSNEVSSQIQEKASAKEVAEYNALAKKYNAQNPGNIVIKKSDVERLKYLYGKMTVKQREKAASFPDLPPPPPAPDAPTIKKGVNDLGTDVPPPPPAPDAPKAKKWKEAAYPPPPPKVDTPQPAPDPAEYVIEMVKKGADFYVGPHKITPKEAIELVRKSSTYKIRVDETNALRPIVHFDNC